MAIKGVDVKFHVHSAIGRVLMTAFLIGLYGCATLIHGTTQDIPITTKPEAAVAKTGEGLACTTPCQLTLSRKKDHVINIAKEGYEETSVHIQHVISGAVAGNIIAGGLIGWGIDAASGGQYRLVPEFVNIELKPIKSLEKPALIIDKLKELEALKSIGAVSEDEYNRMKTKILENLK